MQLSEQEIKDLIRLQKVYAALVRAQEHLEAAISEIDTANSEAYPGSEAQAKTNRRYERLDAMQKQNFKLLCDVFTRPNIIKNH